MSQELIEKMIAALRLYESTYMRTQRHPTVTEEAFVMMTVLSVLEDVDEVGE